MQSQRGTNRLLLWLMGGTIVVLLVLLIATKQDGNLARAQDGGAASAGGIIALTGAFSSDLDILYVVDTNNQVILAYTFRPPGQGRGGLVTTGTFEFLAARHYKWDTLVGAKITVGKVSQPYPSEMLTKFKALGTDEENEASKKK